VRGIAYIEAGMADAREVHVRELRNTTPRVNSILAKGAVKPNRPKGPSRPYTTVAMPDNLENQMFSP
jgi:hypothetical protein